MKLKMFLHCHSDVIDLRDTFPAIPPDKSSYHYVDFDSSKHALDSEKNTITKVFHMLIYISEVFA